ncbi:MAG: DNA-binding MarR family transcriptional regulator [Sulfitobacter sp.]|jgi:DNA-binding MarR family transcriptional regulator
MARAQRKDSPDSEIAFAPDSTLEQLVGYNLKRAYVIVQNDYRDVMGDHGLSPRVFAALSFVVGTPQLTQSELARRLGIERSGLVSIVDELEGRGYLNRAAVPGDRRVQALIPTVQGIAAFEAAVAQVQAHEEALLHDMSAVEKQQLLVLLRKIRKLERG